MNLLISLVLTTTLAGSGWFPSAAPDSGSIAFTNDTTWLRAAPQGDSKRLALLPQGSQVRVIKCATQSCKVSFRRLLGYVGEERLQIAPVGSPVEAGRGYINSRGQWIPSPTQTLDGQPPTGSTARCRDGSYSFSQSRRGTCSWHGGVAQWL
jgi:hypothetical protein